MPTSSRTRTNKNGWKAGKLESWDAGMPSSLPAFKRSSLWIGFTLIELLVVLVIVVVMSLMVVPSFVGYQADAQLRSASRQVVAVLHYARSRSVSTGKPVVVEFDAQTNSLRVLVHRTPQDTGHGKRVTGHDDEWEALFRDQQLEVRDEELVEDGSALGRTRTLQEPIDLAEVRRAEGEQLTSQQSRVDSQGSEGKRHASRVTFFPDGTATAAQILLQNQRGRTHLITLDPVTGLARVEEGNEEQKADGR